VIDSVCDRNVNFVAAYVKVVPAFSLKELVENLSSLVKELARLGSNKEEVHTLSIQKITSTPRKILVKLLS